MTTSPSFPSEDALGDYPGALTNSDPPFCNYRHQRQAISFVEPGPNASCDSARAPPHRLRNKMSALKLRKLVFKPNTDANQVSDSDFEGDPDPESGVEQDFENFMDTQEFERDWNTVRVQDLEERMALLKEQVAEDSPRNLNGEVLPWDATTIGQTLLKEQDVNEESCLIFQHKLMKNINYSLVSAHLPASVPYPMSYDPVTIQSDHDSHRLVKAIFNGHPSIHPHTSKPPQCVLDLGCGDGTWIFDAAKVWKGTKFFGLDVQRLYPSAGKVRRQHPGVKVGNIRFKSYNFLMDSLPFADNTFDMVRMSRLKWVIPSFKWSWMLGEVYRVLRRGGKVEIIDDDFMVNTHPNGHTTLTDLEISAELQFQLLETLGSRMLPIDLEEQDMKDRLLCFNYVQSLKFDIGIPVTRGDTGKEPMPSMTRQPAHILNRLNHPTAPRSLENLKIHASSGSVSKNGGAFGSLNISRFRSNTVGSSLTAVSAASGETLSSDEESHDQLGMRKGKFKRPTGRSHAAEVFPNVFVPLSKQDLIACASHNSYSLLACKEAMRTYVVPKPQRCKDLEARLHGAMLTKASPQEVEEYKELNRKWLANNKEFDEKISTFDRIISKRLNLVEPQWFSLSSAGRRSSLKSLRLNAKSSSSKSNQGSPSHKNTGLLITCNLDLPVEDFFKVRVIRVFTGWK